MTDHERLNREKLIKRAAVGGALLFSAPIVVSPARAAVQLTCGRISCVSDADCKRNGCDSCNQGGTCTPPYRAATFPCDNGVGPQCDACRDVIVCVHKKNGLDCYCYPGANGAGQFSGCCVCKGNILCDNSPPCNTNVDCPKGWQCTFNCCGQTCVPPCGQGIPPGTGGNTAVRA